MKKLLFFTIILLYTNICFAQNNATYDSSSSNQESDSWRIFYSLVQSNQYDKAVEKGIALSKYFSDTKKYKEAFSTCRKVEQIIYKKEKENDLVDYSLRYKITKERLRLYTNIHKTEQCNQLITQLSEYASKSSNLSEDLLLTQASCYRSLGLEEKSLACYKQLISKKTKGKDSAQTAKFYNEMILSAQNDNNALLTRTIKKLYTNWQDSINASNAAIELKTLQNEHSTFKKEIEKKNSTIKKNLSIIVVLGIICIAIAAFALVILGILLKTKHSNKKLKNSLMIANNNNEQKSKFISCINKQINPTLEKIRNEVSELPSKDIVYSNIDALQTLTDDIHNYIEIEETRDEFYPVEEFNVFNLCKDTMEKAKVYIKDGIQTEINVPKVIIRSNPEAIEKILLHLLDNAAKYTEKGKISLEFKKRSAHSGQFLITDTGNTIPDEKKALLFKPFANKKDITEGSGLGLPTCALMAIKLNGNIHIDNEHKNGTRFILELHS